MPGRSTYSDDVEEVRRVAAGVQRVGATGWARATCPLCPSRVGTPDRGAALGINFSTGGFHCFRCHAKGHVDGLGAERDREGPPLPRRAAIEQDPGLGPPDDFTPLWREPGASALSLAPARKYLERRGVPSQTVEEVGIGACSTGKIAGRVVVPIVSPDGAWVGWQARLWTKSTRAPKYLTATGMNREFEMFNAAALEVETDAPVLCVEGTFDALPYWPDVAAFLGKPSEGQVGRLYRAKRPIVVALDGDSWLEAEMLALRLRFDRRRAGWVRLPPTKDPNTVDPAWLWDEARRSLDL